MSRTSSLITLGILIILVPFSGFPIAVRSLLTSVFGLCVLGISLSLRRHDTIVHEVVSSSDAQPSMNDTVS